MIVVLKRNNIALIVLIFLLSITVYSLNVVNDDATTPVTANQTDQKVVLLDPGHGGEDPGAVSDYSGLAEKEVNLYIAKIVESFDLELFAFHYFLSAIVLQVKIYYVEP